MAAVRPKCASCPPLMLIQPELSRTTVQTGESEHRSRRQLLHRLEEVAVATDRQHLGIGLRELRTDGRREREAHRAESARGDVRPRPAGDPALLDHPLRQPRAGDDDRVFAGGGLDLADGAGHRHRRRIRAGLLLDLPLPLGSQRRDLVAVAGRGLAGADRVEEVLQPGLRVTDQRHGDGIVLADLALVDVELDQPRRRDREGHPAPPRRRRPVDEAAADRQQHVGGRRQRVADRRAGVADRLTRERVGLVDRPLPVPGRHDRRAEPLGELHELRRSLRADDPAAGDDHRPLRLRQQPRRLLDGRGIRPWPAARLALVEVGERDGRRLGLDVHRHVQQDRSGPAGAHRVPGSVEDERQLVDARRLPPFLDDRLEDPRVVGDVAALELLEQPVPAHVGVRRAGEEGDRGRVDVGRRHADHRVRRAGTDGREGQHRLTGGAVVAVGEMDGGLLVHDLDGLDRIGAVEEGIGQGPAAVPGDAGRVADAGAREVLDDDLCAGEALGGMLHTCPRSL